MQGNGVLGDKVYETVKQKGNENEENCLNLMSVQMATQAQKIE